MASYESSSDIAEESTRVSGQSVDLRALDYVSSVDRNLQCPICHCPFIRPRRLRCDHTFCEDCLARALDIRQTTQSACPSCRTLVAPMESLPVGRVIQDVVDELVVECPNHQAGCTARPRRGHVHDHIRLYCDFSEIPCSASTCKMTVPRHRSQEGCLHATVVCTYCDQQMPKREIKKHDEAECTEQMSRCVTCNEEFIRKDFTDHAMICPTAQSECLAATLGCKFKAARAVVAEHEGQCALAALEPTLRNMNLRLGHQEKEVEVLRDRNKQLQNLIDATQMLTSQTVTSLEPVNPRPGSHVEHSSLRLAANFQAPPEDALFDSATHHLLSLHESLREDLDRLSGSLSELDARSSMMVMNENLRIREDMSSMNAAIGSLRMQVHWLTSARLQTQMRSITSGAQQLVSATIGTPQQEPTPGPGPPSRRLSDSAKQDTKL